MVNVTVKPCDYAGCTKSAHFGPRGGPVSRCCSHKESGMVNIGGKSCDHPSGCITTANFGPRGGSALRCSSHKEPNMVNVTKKLCNHPSGCSKTASVNLQGGTAGRCSLHQEGVDGGDIPPVAKRQRMAQLPAPAPEQ